VISQVNEFADYQAEAEAETRVDEYRLVSRHDIVQNLWSSGPAAAATDAVVMDTFTFDGQSCSLCSSMCAFGHSRSC